MDGLRLGASLLELVDRYYICGERFVQMVSGFIRVDWYLMSAGIPWLFQEFGTINFIYSFACR
jgi:hypothetical protein